MPLDDVKILVAVYLITYNHEDFIEDAIESVMMQKTFFKYKLFVGEDYSLDRTREICTHLKQKYPDKIELYLNSPNLGAKENALQIFAACFNSGSKYVAMIEGDDFWTDPFKLQKQIDILENNPRYALCYHAFSIINERSEHFDTSYLLNKNVAPPENKCDLQHYVRYKSIKTLTLVYRRELVSETEINLLLRDSPAPASGDIPLIFLLLTKGDGYFIPDDMGVYRLHPGGITNSNRKRVDPWLVTTMKLYNRISDSNKRLFLKRRLISALKESLINGKFGMALRTSRALIGFRY